MSNDLATGKPTHSRPFARGAAMIACAAAVLSSASPVAMAQTPASAAPAAASDAKSAQTSIPVSGGYVVDGGERGDWGFMMGPTGSPNMQMKLIRANADHSGAVGFMCSRATGEMGLAILLPGMPYEVGKPKDIKLTVADRENKLRVVVRAAPAKGKPPVIETGGLAIPDILKAMGEVPAERINARLKFDDGAGHVVSFPLTKPHAVASQASQICSGWALAVTAAHGPAARNVPTIPAAAPSAPAAPSAKPSLTLPPGTYIETAPIHDTSPSAKLPPGTYIETSPIHDTSSPATPGR